MKNIFICFFLLMSFTNLFSQTNSTTQEKVKALFGEKDSNVVEKTINSYLNSNDEAGLKVVVTYYQWKGQQAKADSIRKIAVVKYPIGDIAYEQKLSTFQNAESYKEKLNYSEEIIKNFPSKDLSVVYGSIAMEAAKLRDCERTKTAYEKITDGSSRHNYAGHIAEILLTDRQNNDPCSADFLERLINDYKKDLLEKVITEKAPSFTLSDLDGNVVSLESLKGKTVVLDFWATWCKPCLQSFPGMQEAVNRYQSNPDVVFLFVNTGEMFSKDVDVKVKKVITDGDYSFKVLMDRMGEDKRFAVSDAFKITGLPTKIIIDRNGDIRFKIVGGGAMKKFISEEIEMMVDIVSQK